MRTSYEDVEYILESARFASFIHLQDQNYMSMVPPSKNDNIHLHTTSYNETYSIIIQQIQVILEDQQAESSDRRAIRHWNGWWWLVGNTNRRHRSGQQEIKQTQDQEKVVVVHTTQSQIDVQS